MRGDLTVEETEAIVQEFEGKLQGSLEKVRTSPPQCPMHARFQGQMEGYEPAQYSHTPVPTGVPEERLAQVIAAV